MMRDGGGSSEGMPHLGQIQTIENTPINLLFAGIICISQPPNHTCRNKKNTNPDRIVTQLILGGVREGGEGAARTARMSELTPKRRELLIDAARIIST